MWTSAQIRRYISCLAFWQLFTTRDVLNCGSRAAVDKALSRLVKAGYIQRVARGVFARVDPASEMTFSALTVARIKVESFGRRMITHAADAVQKLGLVKFGNREPTFSINGRSSSFKFGDVVIHLKESSPRKIHLADGNAGMFIRALWHLGPRACAKPTIELAGRHLLRSDRREILLRSAFMPAWLKQSISRGTNVMVPPSPEHWHDFRII